MKYVFSLIDYLLSTLNIMAVIFLMRRSIDFCFSYQFQATKAETISTETMFDSDNGWGRNINLGGFAVSTSNCRQQKEVARRPCVYSHTNHLPLSPKHTHICTIQGLQQGFSIIIVMTGKAVYTINIILCPQDLFCLTIMSSTMA